MATPASGNLIPELVELALEPRPMMEAKCCPFDWCIERRGIPGRPSTRSPISTQGNATLGLKLGRTEDAVRSKAGQLSVSLKPINQSPTTAARSRCRTP